MKIFMVWLVMTVLMAVFAYSQHSEKNSLSDAGRNAEAENWSELANMEVVLQDGNILG